MRIVALFLSLLAIVPAALADPIGVHHKDATSTCPAYTYVVLETRDAIGQNVFVVNDEGTADLYIYIGSDDHPHRGGTSPYVPGDNEVCAGDPNETPDTLII